MLPNRLDSWHAAGLFDFRTAEVSELKGRGCRLGMGRVIP